MSFLGGNEGRQNGKCVRLVVNLTLSNNAMASTSEIRNRVIDRIMAISDPDYLEALDKMIETSNIDRSKIPLTDEQKIMLAMSDEDIKSGRIIDQETLNDQELKWLTKK